MADLEFVRKIQLKNIGDNPNLARVQHAQKKDAETPDNTKQGLVCGGSAVSFTDRLKGQQKRDVLNSTLFAQLAADFLFNRDMPKWYDYYVSILAKIGYVTEGFHFTEYKSTGQTFTMDKVVLEILEALATEDEMAVVKATLDAFKALEDDAGQVALFDHYSKHITSGGYQVFPCTVDSNNDVVLSLGGFYFDSSQVGTKILFFSYSSRSTSLYKSGQKTVLNLDVYDQVREIVIEKLGDRAKTDIADIPI